MLRRAREARLAALAREQAQAEAARDAQALAALRAEQEAARRAAIEQQRRLREAELARQREEAARIQAARELAQRRQQLAQLNSTLAPENTATNVLTGTVPAPTAPRQDSFLGGDSALASILGAANSAANQASTGPSFSQGGGVSRGTSLTQGETEAVLNQLRRCWRVDTFSANARSQVVTLRAQIRQNGFVNQATIQVAAPLPTPPEYRIAVERAISALQDRRCQPFALPPAKYNAWRDIVIRFRSSPDGASMTDMITRTLRILGAAVLGFAVSMPISGDARRAVPALEADAGSGRGRAAADLDPRFLRRGRNERSARSADCAGHRGRSGQHERLPQRAGRRHRSAGADLQRAAALFGRADAIERRGAGDGRDRIDA